MAGQDVVEGTTEAVDVGPDVGSVEIEGLFGGHEVERAHDDGGVIGQVAVGVAAGAAMQSGQAEVENLDDAKRSRLYPAVGTDQLVAAREQIRRFDVAVDQALFVDVLQTERRLANVVTGPLRRQRALLDESREVHALHVFHDQEVIRSDGAGVIRMDHMRVGQCADELNFAMKSAHDFAIRQQFLANELQRHDTVHVLMPGLEDLAAAAFAETFEENVGPEDQFLPLAAENLIELI